MITMPNGQEIRFPLYDFIYSTQTMRNVGCWTLSSSSHFNYSGSVQLDPINLQYYSKSHKAIIIG